MVPVRDRVKTHFSQRLFDGDEDRARRLERALYNWTVRTARKDGMPQYWENQHFKFRYTTKALSIIFNVCNPKNEGLRKRLETGEMQYATLPETHHYVLFPEHWEPIFERVATLQLKKQLTKDLDTVPDGAFQCSRCKSRKTTYIELQTRSADEPATLYIQCMACGKRWKG